MYFKEFLIVISIQLEKGTEETGQVSKINS